MVLACLLHDAGESYLSDVPSPFKKHLKDYIQMEDRILSLIYQKFLHSDLTEEEASKVLEIDKDLLKHDLFYLLGEGEEEALPKLKKPYQYGELSFRDTECRYLEIFSGYTIK